MHLHWPWPGKKTPQFSREWVLVASLRNWNSWDARGPSVECISVATHNSAAQQRVSSQIQFMVWWVKDWDTQGALRQAGGLTKKFPNRPRRISANCIVCCLSAPKLSSRAWTCDNCDHGACGGCIPGLACHKGSVNGKSSYSHIGRHTKKI